MAVFTVQVGVATCRPPRHHATIRVLVEADSGDDAELAACQLAMCHRNVVMAVFSVVLDDPTDPRML